MSFRSNASYGKRQEYKAIAKLLELGFDVYQTLIDDQAIDCIIRLPGGKRYLDIQIKARSKTCVLKSRGFFPLLPILNPRDNYFFILYSEHTDNYWILPCTEIVRLAAESGTNVHVNRGGSNKGKYAVRTMGANGNVFERMKPYMNESGFALLK
jgi:hypothetical protein